MQQNGHTSNPSYLIFSICSKKISHPIHYFQALLLLSRNYSSFIYHFKFQYLIFYSLFALYYVFSDTVPFLALLADGAHTEEGAGRGRMRMEPSVNASVEYV